MNGQEPARNCFAFFPAITMHAVSQEPEPCIYAQLETTLSEVGDEDDSGEELHPEIRLVPKDATICEFPLHVECAAQMKKQQSLS